MPKQIISKKHNMQTILNSASRQPMQRFNKDGKMLNLKGKNATIDKALRVVGEKGCMAGDSATAISPHSVAITVFAGVGVIVEPDNDPNYSFLDDEVAPLSTNLGVILPSQIGRTKREIDSGNISFTENTDPWYELDPTPINTHNRQKTAKAFDEKSAKLASELFCQVASLNMSIPADKRIKHFREDK